MQARPAELRILLDESGFQSVLARADGGRVAGGSGADDGDIVDLISQGVSSEMSATLSDAAEGNSKQTIVLEGNCRTAELRNCRIERASGRPPLQIPRIETIWMSISKSPGMQAQIASENSSCKALPCESKSFPR
jgi:hypothetical protein